MGGHEAVVYVDEDGNPIDMEEMYGGEMMDGSYDGEGMGEEEYNVEQMDETNGELNFDGHAEFS